MTKKRANKPENKSTKERLRLYIENEALITVHKQPILTEEESDSLYESFNKDSEIRIFNEWFEFRSSVYRAITDLQTAKFKAMAGLNDLKGYLIIWETIQAAEEVSNHILYHIEDPKIRARLGQLISQNSYFYLSEINIDKDGYLKIDIGASREDNLNLLDLIKETGQGATKASRLVVTLGKVILGAMEVKDIEIKCYKEVTNMHLRELIEYRGNWFKYNKEKDETKDDKRFNKLLDKYKIYPDITSLEVDSKEYKALFKTYFNE
jgi:hypothetical protein